MNIDNERILKESPPFNTLPLWTLEEAIDLCRKIENELEEYGYHCALTGGVLYNGSSTKDVDIMIYPHSEKTYNFESAVEVLTKYCNVSDIKKIIDDDDKYPDCKDIRYARYNGKRVDLFFVR